MFKALQELGDMVMVVFVIRLQGRIGINEGLQRTFLENELHHCSHLWDSNEVLELLVRVRVENFVQSFHFLLVLSHIELFLDKASVDEDAQIALKLFEIDSGLQLISKLRGLQYLCGHLLDVGPEYPLGTGVGKNVLSQKVFVEGFCLPSEGSEEVLIHHISSEGKSLVSWLLFRSLGA